MDAVAGAAQLLDAGCGSGRLTVSMACAGARVTAIDTSESRLELARARAAESGIQIRLLKVDFNAALPFESASFDAVVARLSLMAADDPVFTLREFARVLRAGGRVATAVWASTSENPWFAEPRASVATVLGGEAAAFARAFGRLGDVDSAAAVHAAAGLRDVDAVLLQGQIVVRDAAEHWQALTRDIGHFKRLAGAVSDLEQRAIVANLAGRLESYRQGARIALPRALVLVRAVR